MKECGDVVEINGVEYVRKESVKATNSDGLPYVVIRTYSAGVHAGYLRFRDGKEVHLIGARRIWYWKGAASLSQLAVDGVSLPNECKFSIPTEVILTEAIEVLMCTEKAQISIQGVPVWKA